MTQPAPERSVSFLHAESVPQNWGLPGWGGDSKAAETHSYIIKALSGMANICTSFPLFQSSLPSIVTVPGGHSLAVIICIFRVTALESGAVMCPRLSRSRRRAGTERRTPACQPLAVEQGAWEGRRMGRGSNPAGPVPGLRELGRLFEAIDLLSGLSEP